MFLPDQNMEQKLFYCRKIAFSERFAAIKPTAILFQPAEDANQQNNVYAHTNKNTTMKLHHNLVSLVTTADREEKNMKPKKYPEAFGSAFYEGLLLR